MAASSKRHERAGLWWGVLLVLGAGVLVVLHRERQAGAARVAREDVALAAARALLAAETRHRAQAGRFVWLEDLAEAGPLPCTTTPGPHGLECRTPGYRLEVLLPSGKSPLGEVLLGQHGAAVDPLLAARYLAVVARPLEPGQSGWRIFYLDEGGRVFVQENVADAEGSRENALPRARLERPHAADEPGPVWRLLDDLDKNP